MIAQRVSRAVAAAGMVALSFGAFPARAVAASDCASRGVSAPQISWEQPALGLDRTGLLSQGDGQTVAVLSTGVDANQPQLHGRIDAGVTVTGSGAANTDCAGLGTQVAGVIGAAKLPHAAFAGVAPHVRIYPVRVLDSANGGPEPAALADGVRAAIAAKVTVICVPLAVYRDNASLRSAIASAITAGIPVVAAAGDAGSDGNPTAYPASYPGVIAVTALDSTGAVAAAAGEGGFVRLGAPGVQVITLQTGGRLVGVDGTGVASGFVAGTVALVRNRQPHLGPYSIQRLLVATANPTQTAPGDPLLAGLVDPYRALTEQIASGTPAAIPGYRPPKPSGAELAEGRARHRAVLLAGVTIAAALVLAMLAIAAPKARRRSWRPVLAAHPSRDPAPDDPSPPLALFAESDR